MQSRIAKGIKYNYLHERFKSNVFLETKKPYKAIIYILCSKGLAFKPIYIYIYIHIYIAKASNNIRMHHKKFY